MGADKRSRNAQALLGVAASLAGMRMDSGRSERLIEAYKAVEKGYASRRQEKLVEDDMRFLGKDRE